MSLECPRTSYGIIEPWFFYRQHDLDIKKPEEPKTVADQCRRIALATMPILSYTFYYVSEKNPIWQALNLGMNGARALSSLAKLQEGIDKENSNQIAWGAFQTAFSSAAFIGMLIARPVGLLIATSQDITLNVGSLLKAYEQEDFKRVGEMGAKIVTSSLYLGNLFVCSSGLWLAISSAQILMSLYSSADELQKGNYLECGAHLLMSLWRLPQLAVSVFLYDESLDPCDDC